MVEGGHPQTRDRSPSNKTLSEAQSALQVRQWVGIVANAFSGTGAGRARVDRLVRELQERGFESRVAWTLPARSAMVAEARSEQGCRCLVAAGGDGTIAALVNEGPRVPLTVLSSGTENLFARHFGLRGGPEQLAEVIAVGRRARLDLGLADDHRFTLMAGIGFDADVVTRHHLARVSQTGRMRPTHRAAYVESVLRSSFSYNFPPLTIRVEDPGDKDGQGEILTGSIAFLFNLPRYALGLPIAPTARGDDGQLDLVVFRNPGPFHALRYLWLVLRGLHLRRPGVCHRRVRRISVTTTEPVPVQFDGDPGGMVTAGTDSPPWTAQVLPGAIEILVPDARVIAEVS
ncbi:diacylglycerol kinase family protein [soil metagenome]